MPAWNPRANDIFLTALDLRSPEERRAYLDGACAGDAGLRAQVEALLSASDRAGSFLERPAVEEGTTTPPPAADPLDPLLAELRERGQGANRPRPRRPSRKAPAAASARTSCSSSLSGKQLLAVERRSPLRGSFLFTSRPALSRDGRTVAVAQGASAPGEGGKARTEGDLRVWDVGIGQELIRFTGETVIAGAALSPDGRQVAATYQTKEGKEGEVKVWDVATGQEVRALVSAPGAPCGLAFSADGGRLAFVGLLGNQPVAVKVWEVAPGRELLSLRGAVPQPSEVMVAVAFSPDGERVAWTYGGVEGAAEVKVHEVAGGRLLLTLRGHAGCVEQVAFSPDGRRIVSTGPGRTFLESEVKVWDAAGGKELLSIKAEGVGRVSSAVFSPDGRHLHAAGQPPDGQGCAVKVWDGTPRAEERK